MNRKIDTWLHKFRTKSEHDTEKDDRSGRDRAFCAL